MTRINVGVHPSELPDKLLLAEHREIKRIPNVIKSGRYNMDGIPEQFTLGKGHVKFFYNKLRYLSRRYFSIYLECTLGRRFNVQDFSSAFFDLPEELLKDYCPTPADRQLIIDRINSKGFQLLPLN